MIVFLSLISLLAGLAVQLLLLEYEVSKFRTPLAGWIETPTYGVVVLSGVGLVCSLIALAVGFWVIVRHLDVPRLFWYSLGASVLSTVGLWALLGSKLPVILVP